MAAPSIPSTPSVEPGARVRHPDWGPGVVIRLTNGGRHVIVRLDRLKHTQMVFAAREFVVEAPAPKPVAVKAPVPTPVTPEPVAKKPAVGKAVAAKLAPAPPHVALVAPLPERAARAPLPEWHTSQSPERAEPADTRRGPPEVRQALEALRLGVVPPTGLSRLTVGRDGEQRKIAALVNHGRGMVVLSGGYGSGKTHLVELAEAEGLAANMLVARASFDPEEVPPSHPLRVYAALMSGLRYPEGAGRGLSPLFDRLAASPEHSEPKGASAHRWLTPSLWAHKNFPGGTLAAELQDWVQGTANDQEELSRRLRVTGWTGRSLLALPDWRTFGQVMAHLLGGIATWARDAGWRGLLVLLDEAEYFDHLDMTARGMAENVLRYLAIASLPDADLPFDPAEVYRGGQQVHRDVSPRFRDDQPLAVGCAFTPNPRIDEALPKVVRESTVLRLEPIAASTYPQLADNVLQIVHEAYPDLVSEAAHEQVVKQALAAAWESGRVVSSRQAARMLVEHWDLFRFDPARAARALRGPGR